MIKIEVRKMQIPCLMMEGECIEIAAEVGVAIGAMYNKIRMVSPQAAEKFQAGVMASTMPDAPTWEHFDLHGGVTQCVTVPKPRKERGDEAADKI